MKTIRILLVVLVVTGAIAAPALASHTDKEDPEDEEDEETDSEEEQEEDDEDSTIIDFSGISNAIEDLTDEIQDFTGDWDATLEDLLIAVIFAPFRTLAQQLVRHLTLVLTNTPAIYPNPAVEDIHRQVLLVTYLLSTLVFTTAGILYIIGPVLGISYSQVRMILPRTLIALVFATVSLPVLQLGVDFSDALVHAFAPTGLTMSFTEMAGITTGLVLAWVINSALLLAVVALFLIRSVYIMFVAAISPLLALGWALPRVRRYSDTFIAGWFAALLMAPLDVLVLKFSMALLSTSVFEGTQAVSNWVLGVASFSLLLFIPFQLYGASQTAVGQARSFSKNVKKRTLHTRNNTQNIHLNTDEKRRLELYRTRRTRQQVTDGGRDR